MKQAEENETTIEEATDQLDFTRPDFVFLPPGNHTYRQQGYYLVCKSCEIQHACWIGPHKIMVGVDASGAPLIKKRTEVGM